MHGIGADVFRCRLRAARRSLRVRRTTCRLVSPGVRSQLRRSAQVFFNRRCGGSLQAQGLDRDAGLLVVVFSMGRTWGVHPHSGQKLTCRNDAAIKRVSFKHAATSIPWFLLGKVARPQTWPAWFKYDARATPEGSEMHWLRPTGQTFLRLGMNAVPSNRPLGKDSCFGKLQRTTQSCVRQCVMHVRMNERSEWGSNPYAETRSAT